MKLKNVDILNGLQALGLMPEILPVKVGYAVNKNTNEFNRHLKDISDTRKNKIKQYTVHENGKPKTTGKDKNEFVFETDEDEKNFKSEMEELFNEEIEVIVHKIPLEVFNNIEINRHLLEAIDFMIDG